MANSIRPNRKRLILYSALLLLIFIIIVVYIENFPFGKFPDDFFAYWSSGQLILRGENPYSPINSMMISQEIGFGKIGIAYSYFYPPWTLPVFVPFGMITYQISRTIWLVLSLLVIMVCSSTLWGIYEGPKNKRWGSLLLVLTLSPLLFALVEGQVSPIILIGLTGFLYFEKKESYLLSGVFLGFATIKIHILYIFWISLIIWMIKFKRWRIIWGFLIALGIMTTIALLLDQNVIQEYIQMNIAGLPQYCNNPTFSSILCSLTGSFKSWYLLVAPVIGIMWLILYWQKKKDHWDWKQAIPLLIPISLLSAPYVWGHDNLLILIPVVEISILVISFGFTHKLKYVSLIYIIANLVFFISLSKLRIDQNVYILMPLIFLVLYVYSKSKLLSRKERLT